MLINILDQHRSVVYIEKPNLIEINQSIQQF